MPTPVVVIAGCGDIGCRLADQLPRDWTLYGLRRNPDLLPGNILPVAGDLQCDEPPAAWPQGPIDYLVYCATPVSRDEAGYRAAYVEGLQRVLGWLAAAGQSPRRVLFISSSSVYGQQSGEWVDETSDTESSGYSGRVMREAEQIAARGPFPATAVRLTGIYGPGRSDLVNRVRQGYRVSLDPPVYANRIHADDAAGLLAFLLQADADGVQLADCYLGVDDEPVALADVVGWLRLRLGVDTWSDSESIRRAGSKRCSNARARGLGWAPRYPSYRDGYEALLDLR